jgi:general secretion pathway protein F/type IV pilus assembly protein PilC
MLLDGGVPLASALELAQQTIHHPQLERSIERAKNRLLEGSRLSFELGRAKEIPPLFSRMVQIGEETGRMAELVEQVGSMYDQESKRILERSLTLLQPIVLILMGIMIGVVLLSILMPLSDIGGGIDVYAG